MSDSSIDTLDDFKRKRESSSNSTNSVSALQIEKKAKEDISVPSDILENSVFSTPVPSTAIMASSHDISALESRTDGAVSNPSVAINGFSSTHEHKSPPPVASHQSSNQEFHDLNQGSRDFVINLLKVTREQFKEEVNDIVDRKLLNQKEEIAQHVYAAVSHDVDNKLDDFEQKYNALQLKYDKLEAKVDKIDRKSVENDQYARRYTIRIRGIEEHRGENLRATVVHIVRWLQIEMHESDIEVIHRVGSYERGKHRVIVCRFKDRGLKYAVMMQRRHLKGKGITFEEDLCKEYETIMHQLRDHRNVSRVWSWNGKVNAEDKNGVKHILRYGRDWIDFFNRIDDQPQNRPPITQNTPHHAATAAAAVIPPAITAQSTASSAPPASTAGSVAMSTANISTAVVCNAPPSITTASLAQSTSTTLTTVTSSVMGPIPASSIAASSGVPYSMAAAVPPLRIPLKDIGNASVTMGGPPMPTRLPGHPNVTMSPRAPSKQMGNLLGFPLIQGGSLPGSPLAREQRRGSTSSQRTPRSMKAATERPPISPKIASYFSKPSG